MRQEEIDAAKGGYDVADDYEDLLSDWEELSRAAVKRATLRSAIEEMYEALPAGVDIHDSAAIAHQALSGADPLAEAAQEVLEAASLYLQVHRKEPGKSGPSWQYMAKTVDRYRALLEGRKEERLRHEQRESEIHRELVGGRS